MKRVFNIKSEIIGSLWLALSVFVLCSLVSFDPSDRVLFDTFSGAASPVKNACGHVGAILSELLYKLFGVASFFIVLLTLHMAIKSFRKEKISSDRYGWALVLLCLVAISLSLYTNLNLFGGVVQQGGWIGYVLSKYALSVLNLTGTSIVLVLAYVICVILAVENPAAVFNWAKARWNRGSEESEDEDEDWDIEEPQSVWSQWALKIKNIFGVKNKAVRTELDTIEEDFEEEYDEEVDEEDHRIIPLSPVAKKSLKKKIQREQGFKIESFKRENVKKVARKIKDDEWEMPSLDLLNEPPSQFEGMSEDEIRQKSEQLVSKMEQFSVKGKIVGVKSGPAVTLFEFRPNADVKLSKITDLAEDLCLALSSESVRIIAPIPGRDVVGIETSNANRDTVFIKDIVSMDLFWKDSMALPIGLGRRADGYPMVVDLRKMPHLLVAGSTGSGKSVFVVSMITGMLLRHSPKTLKLILVDPKQVDLAAFNDLPHLLVPPIRDSKKAVNALRWAINEMDKRYRSMSKFRARDLEGFNECVSKFDAETKEEHAQINEQIDLEAPMKSYYFEPLPFIVIIVEEFGDLMSVDKVNVEQAVVRLAQMARACGIHLVLAMQSPRKDVVTGLIKTNIPGRISFKVASKMDSRVILDEGGAERLLSRGDMLFQSPGVSKPIRAHAAYVSEDEIESITEVWKEQSDPMYDAKAMRAVEGSSSALGEADDDMDMGDGIDEFDERYDEILAAISEMKEVSASLLQRKFKLGYPRAARLIEVFESQGVIGPANGSKPRKVLVGSLKDL
ncbi:MAG: DNA translocase FtsK [Bdellovibrionaceae bacterium]|nr:DNA translocase FtsK [Pseudobdellovibrionaceae bacterium]